MTKKRMLPLIIAIILICCSWLNLIAYSAEPELESTTESVGTSTEESPVLTIEDSPENAAVDSSGENTEESEEITAEDSTEESEGGTIEGTGDVATDNSTGESVGNDTEETADDTTGESTDGTATETTTESQTVPIKPQAVYITRIILSSDVVNGGEEVTVTVEGVNPVVKGRNVIKLTVTNGAQISIIAASDITSSSGNILIHEIASDKSEVVFEFIGLTPPTPVSFSYRIKAPLTADKFTTTMQAFSDTDTNDPANAVLGDPKTATVTVRPKQVFTPAEVKKIAAGDAHTLAVTQNGDLYIWGFGSGYRLGYDDEVDQLNPLRLIRGGVQAVSAGEANSMALKTDGSLWAWGNGWYRVPTRIVNGVKYVDQPDVGSHFFVISSSDVLFAHGNNSYGQLGDGTTANKSSLTQIMANVKMVSTGRYNTGAVTKTGELYMWGNNSKGEVGNGSTARALRPVKIMDNVKEVVVGELYSHALTESGDLYAWGGVGLDNGYTNTPKLIMSNIESADIGRIHSIALTKDGVVYGWGRNSGNPKSLLTSGAANLVRSTSPYRIMDGVTAIAAGSDASFAIKSNGELWGWGDNTWVPLGIGYTMTAPTPRRLNNIGSWG